MRSCAPFYYCVMSIHEVSLRQKFVSGKSEQTSGYLAVELFADLTSLFAEVVFPLKDNSEIFPEKNSTKRLV